MEAAARGAANDYVSTLIATGLGVMRNLVVITAADAVVAVGGRQGSLSEIGLALRMGRHVVALSSWRVESEHRARRSPSAPRPRPTRGGRPGAPSRCRRPSRASVIADLPGLADQWISWTPKFVLLGSGGPTVPCPT